MVWMSLYKLTVFAPTVAQEWPIVEACCLVHTDILSKLQELRQARSLQWGCRSSVASLLQGSVTLLEPLRLVK